jgi:hypothetical protein
VGPALMGDARVRGAIAKAVGVATDRRTDEVIPDRTTVLREQLPLLAETLSSDPDFAAATTKPVRERCARDLLTRTDPVVTAAPLITPLVTAALAIQTVHQPVPAI